MIERCTKKRLLFSIVLLVGLSILIVLLEHHLTRNPGHHHLLADSLGKENSSPKPGLEDPYCWLSEEFSIVEECHQCTDLEKTEKSCELTGYQEQVKCKTFGTTNRSCGQLLLLEERRFWILEIFSLILGLFSSSFVIWRQRKLEHQTMLRIQRQINFN